jgi:large subunit ribosomal protein L10
MSEEKIVRDIEEPSLKKDVSEEKNTKEEIKNRRAHVSEEKKQEVESLKKLLNEYETIVLVNLIDLPSNELQVVRKKLRDSSVIKVSKKRLVKKAIETLESKKDLTEFVSKFDNVVPALIFSKNNAFKLASFLRKNKSKVAAKSGQIAPKDLVINAGPTPFTPGPMIGELGSMGVKATVENGKIVVKDDAVVVKEGDEINAKVADLLVKLDIKPMELGLSLVAAYEDGIVLDKDVLDFDESLYVDEIKRIAADAFSLTVGIGYVTKDNVEILIKKAENEVKALIDAAGILTRDNVGGILSKAEKEAENLLGKALPKVEEEKKEESKEELKIEKAPKEEKPKEEVKEEVPKEEEKKEDLKKESSVEKEEQPSSEKKVEKEKVPKIEELKKEEKAEEVPSIDELAKKKKDNTQGGQ